MLLLRPMSACPTLAGCPALAQVSAALPRKRGNFCEVERALLNGVFKGEPMWAGQDEISYVWPGCVLHRDRCGLQRGHHQSVHCISPSEGISIYYGCVARNPRELKLKEDSPSYEGMGNSDARSCVVQ